jgi:hypothetical protein
MAEGRLRAEWGQTSLTVAALVNSNPFRKGPPVTPDQFNPYAPKPQRDSSPAPLALLCNMLLVSQGHKPSVPVPGLTPAAPCPTSQTPSSASPS